MKKSIFYLSFLCVFMFAFCAVSGAASQQETTTEYVDDSVITAKVKAAIMDETTLKTLDIKVVTEKGVVMLSGAVSTQANITKAGEIARGVKGVKSVKNDLRLK